MDHHPVTIVDDPQLGKRGNNWRILIYLRLWVRSGQAVKRPLKWYNNMMRFARCNGRLTWAADVGATMQSSGIVPRMGGIAIRHRALCMAA